MTQSPLIAVVGATASGKTDWALELAGLLGGEIISADSRQVYRGLDIGTAKPSPGRRLDIPHHCLDHVDPRERYHLARFLREARAALADIRARGHSPVLVGGTGQYVWALIEGWDVPEVAPDLDYRAEMEERARRDGAQSLHEALRAIDPDAAQAILPGNVRRVVRALEVHRLTGRRISSWWAARDPIPATIIAPQVDANALDDRIDQRVQQMFTQGLVQETQALLDAGLPSAAPGLGGIGYRQVVAHLNARYDLRTALAETQRATRRLARRQRAWFRAGDPRIQWSPSLDAAREAIASLPGATAASGTKPGRA